MVYSRVIYGIVLYGACRKTLLDKVQVIQNKLLKVLYKLPFRSNTDTLHLNLDILKIKDIYRYQIQKFVYECVNKTCIKQFHNYYRQNHTIRELNTRQQNNLYQDPINTKYGECSLKYHGAKLWNSLSANIKLSQSLLSFKKALRQSIIESYRNNIT